MTQLSHGICSRLQWGSRVSAPSLSCVSARGPWLTRCVAMDDVDDDVDDVAAAPDAAIVLEAGEDEALLVDNDGGDEEDDEEEEDYFDGALWVFWRALRAAQASVTVRLAPCAREATAMHGCRPLAWIAHRKCAQRIASARARSFSASCTSCRPSAR